MPKVVRGRDNWLDDGWVVGRWVKRDCIFVIYMYVISIWGREGSGGRGRQTRDKASI